MPDMKHHGLHISNELLAEFCRRNHIRKLALFGSVLREDFGPDSDVDMLVEFERGHHVGLFGLTGMELELSDLVGRKVDLNTPGFLNPYFRERVLKEAVNQYVAA